MVLLLCRLRTQTFQVDSQLSATFVFHCSVPNGSVLGALKFVTYTEDLPVVIQRIAIDYHLYAGITQLFDEPPITSIAASISNIQHCVVAVHAWCSAKRLQLNPLKFEIIWFGTQATLKRRENTNLCLHVGTDTVAPSNVLRNLGVLLDSELTMRQHISETVGAYFYHLRRLKKVRRILGSSVTCRLVAAFVTSRLDYCNALLAGLPQSTIASLQRVQNAAVHLVSGLRSRDHVTSSLSELHWLPIRYRIMYKLCLTMHNAHVGRSPRYIIDSLSPIADMPNRERLRSSASRKVRTACPTSQDRRASVFILRTRLLEQPADRTNIYYGQNFQIASENPSIQTRI